MNRLLQARYDAGLSIEELAERSGVKARTIREVESGRIRKPRVQTLAPLAQVLGVPTSDLIPGEQGRAA
jgi:transcriptional regulator with XRE-family HTH domain